MNRDHKITQWNTCNYIVLYHSNFINIYRKISPEGGKVSTMSSKPYTDQYSGSEPSGSGNQVKETLTVKPKYK